MSRESKEFEYISRNLKGFLRFQGILNDSCFPPVFNRIKYKVMKKREIRDCQYLGTSTNEE